MKNNFHSRLSSKTAIIFLLAFISIGLPVNWIVYQKLKSTLILADTQQLRAEAEKLASLTNLDPVIVPLPPPGYSVNISQFREGMTEPIFISPDFPPIELNWLVEETVDVDTLKLFGKRVHQPSGSELWFTLARSNKHLYNQLTEIRAYLFYVTTGAFLVMVILVFLIATFMFKPLKKLVESANYVQASEKMQRLPVPASRDEVHQLALSLNEMISRIENTINYQIKFFDSAAHELKTPLSIMRAELSIAYSNAKDLDTQKWISSLQEETARLERSIADFLLLSQLKNQALILRKQKAYLPEIIFDVMQKLKRIADAKVLSFSIQQDESAKAILVDTDKIQTVVFNLIENAIRYCPEGSNITIIHNYSESHMVNISNVTAAPIANMEILGESRYSESQRGMGLGLWISNQLVELHGGSLKFSCTNNQFLVTLTLR